MTGTAAPVSTTASTTAARSDEGTTSQPMRTPGARVLLALPAYTTTSGAEVCIAETGECTAPPACRATHWRNRDQEVMSPAPHMVRERRPSLNHIISHEAAMAGVPIHDFLMDLVANGLELWLEKRENEDA